MLKNSVVVSYVKFIWLTNDHPANTIPSDHLQILSKLFLESTIQAACWGSQALVHSVCKDRTTGYVPACTSWGKVPADGACQELKKKIIAGHVGLSSENLAPLLLTLQKDKYTG